MKVRASGTRTLRGAEVPEMALGTTRAERVIVGSSRAAPGHTRAPSRFRNALRPRGGDRRAVEFRIDQLSHPTDAEACERYENFPAVRSPWPLTAPAKPGTAAVRG